MRVRIDSMASSSSASSWRGGGRSDRGGLVLCWMSCLGFGSLLDVMIEVVLVFVVITVAEQYAAIPILSLD